MPVSLGAAVCFFTVLVHSWIYINFSGKVVSGSNISSSVDIHPHHSKQHGNQQGIEKNPVPYGSNTLVRHVPDVDNNNLVISFSDDDSGSGEEDLGRRKSLASNQNKTTGTVKSQKLLPKSTAKSSKSWKRTNNAPKVIPNKLFLNQTSKVSATKMRGANSRVFGPSSFDQRLQARNSYVLANRNLATRGRGQEQGDLLNTSRLQDLRQQIAIRENELKMKSAQLSKEWNSCQRKDQNHMPQSNVAFRKSSSILAEPANVKLKEPEKKRLKVDESCSIQKSSRDRQEANLVENTFSSKGRALADGSAPDRKKIDIVQKGMPNQQQKPDKNRVMLLKENMEGRVKSGLYLFFSFLSFILCHALWVTNKV